MNQTCDIAKTSVLDSVHKGMIAGITEQKAGSLDGAKFLQAFFSSRNAFCPGLAEHYHNIAENQCNSTEILRSIVSGTPISRDVVAAGLRKFSATEAHIIIEPGGMVTLKPGCARDVPIRPEDVKGGALVSAGVFAPGGPQQPRMTSTTKSGVSTTARPGAQPDEEDPAKIVLSYVLSTRPVIDSGIAADKDIILSVLSDIRSISPKSQLFDGITPRQRELVEKYYTTSHRTTLDDIAGLDNVKQLLKENIQWPLMHPELFQGLRSADTGILLFGPPGTGKSRLGQALADSAGTTFFSISSSSIMSKWMGQSERTVKALYSVAAALQPSCVFIDEIDSLLRDRTSDEDESGRRTKTELLTSIQGIHGSSARVITIGATNRPEELDEAARRRLTKRIYVPLPDEKGREQLLRIVLSNEVPPPLISPDEMKDIVRRTVGYSGADLVNVAHEASMRAIRELDGRGMSLEGAQLRAMSYEDFVEALRAVPAAVDQRGLEKYDAFNKQFGIRSSISM